MRRGRWRGRRLVVLVACIAAAFVATATVLSVSIAATGTFSAAKGKTKSRSGSLTKSQVVALIKQYGKSGSPGATGAAGPKGETGAKGEAGAKGELGTKGETGGKGENGANGAVAGYSAGQPPTGPAEGTQFTSGTLASPTMILSKSLPAGSFLASAKVQVSIVATGTGGEGDVNCELLDLPASGAPAVDVAGFFSATDATIPAVGSGAATTLPLEVALDTSSASTLAIECWVTLGSGGQNGASPGAFFAEAADAQIQAVQTTANG